MWFISYFLIIRNDHSELAGVARGWDMRACIFGYTRLRRCAQKLDQELEKARHRSASPRYKH